MKTFARITVIVLIVTGILILFGGIGLGVTGVVRSLTHANVTTTPVRASGANGLLLLAFIFVEGLMVIATGEGLFLLAGIASKLPL